MTEKTRPQAYRLRRIIELIRIGQRTGKPVNAGHLVNELGVTRRTIIRDLDVLRDEENAPIEYDYSLKGYRLADVTWKLPPVHLSRQEFFSFCVARKLLKAFRGTPLETDMESTFSKLAQTLEGTVTVDLEALTEHVTVLGEDFVQQDAQTWTKMARHIDMQERVVVRYQKFDGTVKSYTLEPLHLLAYRGNWYVLAIVEGRPEPSTFALSRIRQMEGTARYFEVPDGFDIREHIDRAFGIMKGAKPIDVGLLFAPKVATYIRERVWHPDQEMIEQRDGSLELSFRTGGWKELVRWVLSWQPDVQVLEPTELRERVKEKMTEAVTAMTR